MLWHSQNEWLDFTFEASPILVQYILQRKEKSGTFNLAGFLFIYSVPAKLQRV